MRECIGFLLFWGESTLWGCVRMVVYMEMFADEVFLIGIRRG